MASKTQTLLPPRTAWIAPLPELPPWLPAKREQQPVGERVTIAPKRKQVRSKR